MPLQPFVLIGYFPKRSATPPEWLARLGVTRVASVSECIAPGPDDWIQAWTHNDWGCFDSPEAAWSVVPEESRDAYVLHAYAVHPVIFEGGRERSVEAAAPDRRVTPLNESFRAVGYDVVSRSGGHAFECSPLTCNLLAEEVTTNEHALLSDVEAALKLARTVEACGGEPGPYHVVQVWAHP